MPFFIVNQIVKAKLNTIKKLDGVISIEQKESILWLIMQNSLLDDCVSTYPILYIEITKKNGESKNPVR